MRRYRFIDTTAYSQYLFNLAVAGVITSGTTSALTSTAYTQRRFCSTTSHDKKSPEFSNTVHSPDRMLPNEPQSWHVIYSVDSDKIIADKNGLSLYVAAEDKSYPLRARKSYWDTGDYIYIEFTNPRATWDYPVTALKAHRKLNGLNLDKLTPWIWEYNVADVEAAAAAFSKTLESKKSSSTKAKNEKFTPFDFLAVLFCLSMQGAFIGAYMGAYIGFILAPFAFVCGGPPVSEGIKNALANGIVCVGAGAASGAAPITLPAFAAYKFFEYASEKIQHDNDNGRKNRL